jgi:DNA-binding CsgD family transcriptional regulator/tetratricopeptide (TPR) repeat protein
VVELCRRLDGLPLAIELAAVRTRVLSVQQIVDRLADRFDLLTGGGRTVLPRHQTLRTTIDWSHDQLKADEQALLRRLCVFAGRFTLDDVEAVHGAPALDELTSLVDKSLVVREEHGFHLHETMREYAALKLREAGEADEVVRRCADYYRSACFQRAMNARYHLVEWLAWMDLEIDNIRAVLHDTGRLDLVASLGWYWITRATSEGIRRFDELLNKSGKNDDHPPMALFLRGLLAVLQSDPDVARPILERSAAAAEKQGQPAVQSQALSMATIAALIGGDPRAAQRLLKEAEAIGLDDYPAAIAVLQAKALGGLLAGDLDLAGPAAAAGVHLSRGVGDQYSLGMMLLNLGSVHLVAGDLDAAEPPFLEALRLAREIDDRVGQYVLLDTLGCHAAGTGQPERAVQLLAAAETVQRSVGANVLPYLAPLLAAADATTREALGPAEHAAKRAQGAQMTREAAVALALNEAPAGSDDEPSPLRPREAEVADLVADGLSNRQIAARLFLSEHTVDSHIRSIMTKLGAASRAQIAAWAVQHKG